MILKLQQVLITPIFIFLVSVMAQAQDTKIPKFNIKKQVNDTETVTLEYPKFELAWLNDFISDPTKWYDNAILTSGGMKADFGQPSIHTRKVEILPSLKGFIVIKDQQTEWAGGSSSLKTTAFHTINLNSQKKIQLNDIVSAEDALDFTIVAELSFRSAYNIDFHEPLEKSPFSFENNTFYLPDDFYLSPHGIVFNYPIGTITSSAQDVISFTLPYYQLIGINAASDHGIATFLNQYVIKK